MMKAVLLAGGRGTRMSELTDQIPKPMARVLGKEIILHIIDHYRKFGVKEFIVCAGYRQELLKRLFIDYPVRHADVTVDYATGAVSFPTPYRSDWSASVVDTGLDTQTGGRLKRIAHRVAGEPFFLATYGDTVSDVDVAATIDFHRKHGRLATMTAGYPDARFGSIKLEGDRIVAFEEKPAGEGGLVNRGFFVLSPKVLDYVAGDDSVFEREPLEKLAAEGQLMAYRHFGFFHSVDSIRDLLKLEDVLSQPGAGA
jgi:glucose-1-phosphate cytidylyltransferase